GGAGGGAASARRDRVLRRRRPDVPGRRRRAGLRGPRRDPAGGGPGARRRRRRPGPGTGRRRVVGAVRPRARGGRAEEAQPQRRGEGAPRPQRPGGHRGLRRHAGRRAGAGPAAALAAAVRDAAHRPGRPGPRARRGRPVTAAAHPAPAGSGSPGRYRAAISTAPIGEHEPVRRRPTVLPRTGGLRGDGAVLGGGRLAAARTAAVAPFRRVLTGLRVDGRSIHLLRRTPRVRGVLLGRAGAAADRRAVDTGVTALRRSLGEAALHPGYRVTWRRPRPGGTVRWAAQPIAPTTSDPTTGAMYSSGNGTCA